MFLVASFIQPSSAETLPSQPGTQLVSKIIFTLELRHGIFKAKAKADRESYLKSITDEVENDLVHNKMRSVFRGIKQLTGTNTKPLSTTICKADGSPCQSETET